MLRHHFSLQLLMNLAAYPGVVSLILAWSHIFIEIDYEIISNDILIFLLIQEGFC